jgi:hypothetical protein
MPFGCGGYAVVMTWRHPIFLARHVHVAGKNCIPWSAVTVDGTPILATHVSANTSAKLSAEIELSGTAYSHLEALSIKRP